MSPGLHRPTECPENLQTRLKHTYPDSPIYFTPQNRYQYQMPSKCTMMWNHKHYEMNGLRKRVVFCFFCVCLAFSLGLLIGCMISEKEVPNTQVKPGSLRSLNSVRTEKLYHFDDAGAHDGNFKPVSFTSGSNHNKEHIKEVIYPKSITEDMKEILKDFKSADKTHDINKLINANLEFRPNSNTVLFGNIFWGPKVEGNLPKGFTEVDLELWEDYLKQAEIIKMEAGCGRMQNRVVTFRDGQQACVRYRQNTDQIQGEIFSFYVSRLLNITNVAPSVVKVVDTNDKLWTNVGNDITAAQWNVNRPVVITKFIPSLQSAFIPDIFKPSTRHLNKNDVFKMCALDIDNGSKLIAKLNKTKQYVNKFDHIDAFLSDLKLKAMIELAQWSDLIIFDYLTANLDRIANNLFNFQWNVNIMDGPAHNLAKKIDDDLLVFLDNESGLLHGYRLLKKYNIYHSLMLDNLCVFRSATIESLRTLSKNSVGARITDIFKSKNSPVVRDVLPGLPDKNIKILKARIDRILSQVTKCEKIFSKS